MDSNTDPFGPVETPRLRLRCVRTDDAGPISSMMIPAVSRWVATWPVPFTVQMARERIIVARRAANDRTALPFAIERKSDGALLGWIGVTRESPQDRSAMLGYWLGEAWHGQGYMREAVVTAVATAFELLGLEVVEAAVQLENAASVAVLRSCGMTLLGERMIYAAARGRDERCLLYRMRRTPV